MLTRNPYAEASLSGGYRRAGAGQARKYSEVAVISALSHHGPQLLNRMKRVGIGSPQFRHAQEVANLIAYLNSAQ